MILRRWSVWVAIGGVLLTIATLWGANQRVPPPPPLEAPPTSPYPATVAAAGLVEAVNENVRIAPPVSGLVVAVFVAVGDQVQTGDPLFQLDDRALRAQWKTRTDALPPAAAKIAEQHVHLQDMQDQFQRLQRVTDRRAVSEEDLKRKWHAVELAKQRLRRAKAELRLARAEQEAVAVNLRRLTVKAPRDGTVLQVNLRAGEYALVNAADPLLLLGDTSLLQIRADIDEVNAPQVVPGSPAVAYLKGATDLSIPLTFDRIEPYIVPKRSLTGDNRERVDTRVLQVIYQFAKPSFPVYVGQQVDVYIDAAVAGAGGEASHDDVHGPAPSVGHSEQEPAR